jgi:hypothetical protein
MAESGVTMMLRAMGVDPDGIKRDVQQFMESVKAMGDKLDANQQRIEAKLDRIQRELEHPGETVEINKPNGEATGVLLTTEKFPEQMVAEMMRPSL